MVRHGCVCACLCLLQEYARLVSRVLNLQAALSQNMSTPGPVLRHTTTVLSSMVASSLV